MESIKQKNYKIIRLRLNLKEMFISEMMVSLCFCVQLNAFVRHTAEACARYELHVGAWS